METVSLQVNGKCRRRYSPEHAIFAAGNVLRTLTFYREAGVDDVEGYDVGVDGPQPMVFQCRLFNCRIGFQSIRAYEEHYDLVHRNICRECFRSFLSFRLLDIHISETHDAFFRVLSKRQPMYVCLVDGCNEVFKHDDKRMRHLIRDHQYPISFEFHKQRRVQHPLVKSHAVADVPSNYVKASKRRKKKSKNLNAEAEDVTMIQRTEAAPDDEFNASTSVTPSDEKNDVDMDRLADQVANLRIPKSVCFGRRQRRR